MPALIKSDELWSLWSQHQWKRQYLFAGHEDFLIEQACTRLLKHWLGENPNPLSLDRLDAETNTLDEILQSAQTVPFFGGPHVLQIQNARALSVADQESLAGILPSLSAETHCVFIWGKEWRKEDMQKPLVEAVAAAGQVVIFWPPYPEQAQRWLVERARVYRKSLNPQAAAWLIQQSSDSLRALDQELAKCASYVGERADISLDDVQTCFGYRKASSPYDWITFIRQGKQAEALQVLHVLLEEGDEPIRLLAILSRSLRDWLGTKGSGESAAMLAMRFRVKRGEENRFARELDRWSEETLTEALGYCLEAEQAVKTGKETPEMALTLLTLRLGRREPAYVTR